MSSYKFNVKLFFIHFVALTAGLHTLSRGSPGLLSWCKTTSHLSFSPCIYILYISVHLYKETNPANLWPNVILKTFYELFTLCYLPHKNVNSNGLPHCQHTLAVWSDRLFLSALLDFLCLSSITLSIFGESWVFALRSLFLLPLLGWQH